MIRFSKNAGPRPRITAGVYSARMLKRAGYLDLYATMHGANGTLKAADRALEDEEEAVGESYADRDIAGIELDNGARLTLNLLRGTSALAERTSPFVDIAPHGVGEFTGAKVDERAVTFGVLVSRIQEYLRPEDPIRIQQVPILQGRIAEWTAGRETIDEARTQLDLVDHARQKAMDAWDAAYDGVYSALRGRIGKDRAELFFKRTATQPKKPAPAEDTAPAAATDPEPPPAE